jgi:hypothetical protein
MGKGWVKIHRSTFEHELWTAEPFTKGQAWVDLFGNANHAESSFWVRGIEVRVQRGQVAWSEITMAKRWKWSRGKVRRYLGMLENRGMIVQQTNKVTSVVTICNYCTFQDADTTDSTTGGTTGGTTDGQQTDNRRYTNKNVKNEKNEKNLKTTSPQAGDALAKAFERYWSTVKNKVGKKQAEKAFKVKAGSEPETFADKLIADMAERHRIGQFGFDKLHPATYINNERWTDAYIAGSESGNVKQFGIRDVYEADDWVNTIEQQEVIDHDEQKRIG